MSEPSSASSNEPTIGRVALMVIGVCSLLGAFAVAGFAAWEVWGTNRVTAHEQRALASEFEANLAAARSSATTVPRTTTPATTQPPTSDAPTPSTPSTTVAVPEELASEPLTRPDELVSEGSEGVSEEAIARLEIPKIEETWYVVSGVTDEALLRGPGHYTSTAGPGEIGNFSIAGHRTGYGAPFKHLDELAAGDEISVTTTEGVRYTYAVTWVEIVEPDDNWVITASDDTSRELTLTTCHPLNSTAQRLIVRAEIVNA